jgi:hypothetical protein
VVVAPDQAALGQLADDATRGGIVGPDLLGQLVHRQPLALVQVEQHPELLRPQVVAAQAGRDHLLDPPARHGDQHADLVREQAPLHRQWLL